MATAQQFEDLQVWQDARALVKEVYQATKGRSFARDASLRQQMTRAAVSTMSNIAEGFERGSRKEFIQFLTVAKGSNGEVRSQLYVASDQEYLDKQTFENLKSATVTLSRRLARFIQYMRSYPEKSRVRISKRAK
jgi:four helix bundle protein